MAILVILGIWFAVSVLVSLALGALLRDTGATDVPELYAMDGDVAVFCRRDGQMVRVPLAPSAHPADHRP